MLDLAVIAAALRKTFDPTVARLFNRSVIGFSMAEVLAARGPNVQWDATSGEDVYTEANQAPGADMASRAEDTYVPAVLQFASYSQELKVMNAALEDAWASGNPEDLHDLFKPLVQSKSSLLAARMANDWYAGRGVTTYYEMQGLCTVGGPLDNDAGALYAGVDRTTYPKWKSNVLANGGNVRKLKTDLIDQLEEEIYTSCGQPVDMYLTTPYLFRKLGQLVGADRMKTQDVFVRGEKITLDHGWHWLDYKGVPFIRDVRCPAGNIIALNSATIRIRPRGNSATTYKTLELEGTPESQRGIGKLQIVARIVPLANDGDYQRFGFYVYPCSQVTMPHFNGRITDLPTSD